MQDGKFNLLTAIARSLQSEEANIISGLNK